MRRVAALFATILIIICMAPPVLADTRASALDIQASVFSDGSAHISLRMNLRLDEPQASLVFPLPPTAYDILVNGVTGSAKRQGAVLALDLAQVLGTVSGDITVSISYTLPRVVTEESGQLLLELPLLCGFAHPIESTSFTVTLPGDFPGRPTLTSTYHQTRIEESLALTVQGTQAQGTLSTRIMGSDWLTLSLKVSQEMFPQDAPIVWSLNLVDLLMILVALLALVYWLVFLRCLPGRFLTRSTAPDGVNAGDLGPALVMGRPDLTMLVVQWAQLGYILIQVDNSGRVLLHKRMNMDNERSQTENRIFRALFGTRRMIDATGYHYAQLHRKVAAGKPGIHGLFRAGSGNPGIFRLLCSLLGGLSGWAMGSAIGMDSPFQSFLTVTFGLLGLVCGWVIQGGPAALFLRRKENLWVSLGLMGSWALLGLVAGELTMAVCVALGLFLAGLAGAYGGRRTETGKQVREQILGLRRYLGSLERQKALALLKSSPDYFFTLLPYALSLGQDRKFAKAFGTLRMRSCPYLTRGMDGHLTALEWTRLLREAVSAIDRRQRQFALDRLLGR